MLDSSRNKNFKLRIFYKKVGRAAWISHLELLRTIQYSIRRSGLPFVVTQGFSPHMKISFCPALSVGIESESQVFDLYLKEYIAPFKCLDKLVNVFTDDLYPYKCAYVDNDDSSAPKDGCVYTYEVIIKENIKKLCVPKQIEISNKKKIKVLNVYKYLHNDIEMNKINNFTHIKFSLKYCDGRTIKPELFIRKVLDSSGVQSAQIINFKKL